MAALSADHCGVGGSHPSAQNAADALVDRADGSFRSPAGAAHLTPARQGATMALRLQGTNAVPNDMFAADFPRPSFPHIDANRRSPSVRITLA